MRRSLLLLSLALAAVLAACSSSAGPGWTYAPPTEAPASQPAASGDASAAPSTAPSAAPGSEAPASEAPSGGAGGGTVVNLEAKGIAFVETELKAPADTPFTLHFDNQDPSTPHDVVVKDASGGDVWKGELVNGPAAIDYAVPAIKAGSYPFMCSIHPNMTGTLTVGG